jgi:hypothetical protein
MGLRDRSDIVMEPIVRGQQCRGTQENRKAQPLEYRVRDRIAQA